MSIMRVHWIGRGRVRSGARSSGVCWHIYFSRLRKKILVFSGVPSSRIKCIRFKS